MPKKRLLACTALLSLLVTLLAGAASSAEIGPPVSLENEYIRIVVNDSGPNAGRFSVRTTGGDPQRDTDHNKHLIYGGDNPWTSYTTVRIGNKNWVFGGETDRRAGRAGEYGRVIQEPTVVDNTIQSAWQLGPVEVWQILHFARSSTTGLMDTARIEYQVKNTDEVSHMVGLRLMLDTMLGSNDGAPFRAMEREIFTDTVFYSYEMPEFWQAFDSISNPQVISQGTLKGPDITVPDRVYFTNWGSLADDLWEFDFEPYRDFKRKGEFELDSAIALFWNQKALAPGESRSYVSYYGLGGVTITSGDLILGVTAQYQITADAEGFQTFPVIAYIENDGSGKAMDVQAEIKLPPGLKLVGSAEDAIKALGNLEVGETIQTGWQLLADSRIAGSLTYEVIVSATNSEPSKVTRDVSIVSPAKLSPPGLEGPVALGIKDEKYHPPFFEVKGTIKNEGGATAYGVVTELTHPIGLRLGPGQRARKFLWPIEPGEEAEFTWLLVPTGEILESEIAEMLQLYYSLEVKFQSDSAARANSIYLPELKPKIWLKGPEKEPVKVGDIFSVEVWATNIKEFVAAELDLTFDPDLLEIELDILDISIGTLFVDDSVRPPQLFPWQMPKIDNASGKITAARGDRGFENYLGLSYGTLMKIDFRAKSPGTARIAGERAQVWDKDGQAVSFSVVEKEITILP